MSSLGSRCPPTVTCFPKIDPSASVSSAPFHPLCPDHLLGGSGGDSAWRGEGSDVQSVPAVGVGGQSPDAAGSSVRTPQRGPGGFGSGSGRHHATPPFHEVPLLPIIAFHLSPVLLNFLPRFVYHQISLCSAIAGHGTFLDSRCMCMKTH